MRLLLSLSLCACIGRTVPLGATPKDKPHLSDVPSLHHEAEALENGATLRVQDLFTTTPKFVARPTPTALLEGETAANPIAATDATRFTFVTYNVALLDIEGLGLALARSPDIDARRPIIAAAIMDRGYDLVALQELWLAEDLARFESAAEQHGYWLAHSPRHGYTDGLALLIKKSFAAAPSRIVTQPYVTIQEIEFFPGPAISRGFMAVTLQHPTLGEVVV